MGMLNRRLRRLEERMGPHDQSRECMIVFRLVCREECRRESGLQVPQPAVCPWRGRERTALSILTASGRSRVGDSDVVATR